MSNTFSIESLSSSSAPLNQQLNYTAPQGGIPNSYTAYPQPSPQETVVNPFLPTNPVTYGANTVGFPSYDPQNIPNNNGSSNIIDVERLNFSGIQNQPFIPQVKKEVVDAQPPFLGQQNSSGRDINQPFLAAWPNNLSCQLKTESNIRAPVVGGPKKPFPAAANMMTAPKLEGVDTKPFSNNSMNKHMRRSFPKPAVMASVKKEVKMEGKWTWGNQGMNLDPTEIVDLRQADSGDEAKETGGLPGMDKEDDNSDDFMSEASNSGANVSSDSDGGAEKIPRRPRYRKLRERLIQSIDSAENPANYTEIPEPDPPETHTVTIDKGKRTERVIHWTTKFANRDNEPAQTDIMRIRPGVKPDYKHAKTMYDAWCLFFTDDIIDCILKHTNDYILSLATPQKTNINIPLDRLELIAWIGLLYLRGVFGFTKKSCHYLWNEEYGHALFRTAMSQNRFMFINANIRFDDIATRPERWRHDRFAAFRVVFEKFFANCATVMAPDDYLSLDETLYPTRGNISFRQYNKNKPARYGLLFRSISSARMPYTYTSLAFSGVPVDEPGPDVYVPGVDNLVKKLVERLERQSTMSGCCITYDR